MLDVFVLSPLKSPCFTGECRGWAWPTIYVLYHSSTTDLQDKQDNITNTACQEEVFYYQLMEVTDFRNDVILAEACRQDVEKYCKDVEPGAACCTGFWVRVCCALLSPMCVRSMAYAHRLGPSLLTHSGSQQARLRHCAG